MSFVLVVWLCCLSVLVGVIVLWNTYISACIYLHVHYLSIYQGGGIGGVGVGRKAVALQLWRAVPSTWVSLSLKNEQGNSANSIDEEYIIVSFESMNKCIEGHM